MDLLEYFSWLTNAIFTVFIYSMSITLFTLGGVSITTGSIVVALGLANFGYKYLKTLGGKENE